MTNPVPQDMTGQGVPGYWASGDEQPRVRNGYQCVIGGDGCPGHISKWLVCSPPAEEPLGGAAALRAEEARPGDHDGPLPHIAPPYCGVCSPYGGSDPEHTGVSDVQADLDILRGLLTGYLRDDALGVHARDVGFEALNRIESLVRGEQR